MTIESDLDRLAEEAINRRLEDTVARLRDAQGDRTLIEEAVRLYISDGDKLDMSPMELWDYFAISYPGLPAQAGYNTEEARMITDEIFSVEMEKFYEQSGSLDA